MKTKTLKKDEKLNITLLHNKKIALSAISGNISYTFFEMNGNSDGKSMAHKQSKSFVGIEKYCDLQIVCNSDTCTVGYEL